MRTYVNRWTVSAGWALAMLLVWVFFVPAGVSLLTLVVVAAAGFCAVALGGAVVRDSQAPKSVVAILSDLESDTQSPAVPRT